MWAKASIAVDSGEAMEAMMFVWRRCGCDDEGGVSSWEVAQDDHVSAKSEREKVRRRHKTDTELLLSSV